MPNRSPLVTSARLALAAAALICLPATAAWADTPDPTLPAGAVRFAPPSPPAPSAAERAYAAWRHARGLDRAEIAPAPPIVEPARAVGGGNPDDTHWQGGFGLPVPDGFVSALLPMNPLLIVGGSFGQIGDLEAPGLATWDGTGWSTLGDFPGHSVLDLAPYPGGLLALTSTPVVWRWDGSQWSALPPFPTDPDAPAYYSIAMAVEDQQVAVSVWTWTQGLGYRSRVFLWDGSNWTPLGGYFNDGVLALAWYHGEPCAGGSFASLDGAALPIIARWDGITWRSVAAGLPRASYDRVSTLAVFGDELVAAGWFHDELNLEAEPRFFARWNGTRWASLGTGAPAYPNLHRLRVVGSELYALGQFQGDHPYGIARWDGATWHNGEDQLRWMAFDLAPYRGEMYVGGLLSSDGLEAAPALSRQRGGRWESPLMPADGMQGLMGWDGTGVRVLEPTDQGIIAGGRLDFAGAPGGWVSCAGTGLWDGRRWSAFGDRYWDEIELSDLTAYQGGLYAAGYFQRGSEYGSVARFVGGRWVLMSPMGQPFMNATCLASALGNLFLGGGISVGETGGIARWDGTAWHDMGGGITSGNYLSIMTEHGGELIVGGEFVAMGGVSCRNVAAWNPRTGWHPLGDGLDGPVSGLITKDGILYASALGCVSQGVARWKNGRWEKLDSPSTVWALGRFQGRLVASSDGFPGQIAYLDDAGAWRPMGSGLNGLALSFVERDSSLFVGGYFSRSGDRPAYGFAEWRGPLPGTDGPSPPPGPAPAPISQRVEVGPNPSAAAVHLRYDLPTAGHARVEIYDLSGHLVATPFDGEQGAGSQDVTWTPEAGRVAAGVYFGRVTAMGTSHVVRVVRIR